jgi:uncharacterized protein (DUF2141 family)
VNLTLVSSLLAATVFAAGVSTGSPVQAPEVRSSGNCALAIHVDGLRNHKGKLGGAIFTSSDGWPEVNDKSFRHDHIDITGSTATLTFDHIPAGNYGVVVLHDENENQHLDRNLVGWPKEGFGFANNPHVALSAPPWKAALVHVTCPRTETTIHIIYK